VEIPPGDDPQQFETMFAPDLMKAFVLDGFYAKEARVWFLLHLP
jgi:hypothetical protein